MKALFVFLSLFVAGFVTVSGATESSRGKNRIPCESYENYEECGDNTYVGPDGQAYDDQGNPVDDSGGGFYEDTPQDGDSGYLNGTF